MSWTSPRRVQQNDGVAEPTAAATMLEETPDDDTSHAAGRAPAPRRHDDRGCRRPRQRNARRPRALLRHALAPLAGAAGDDAGALPRHPRLRTQALARPAVPRR